MLNLASKNIRELARDKKLLIFSFFFPAFLLVISHYVFSGTEAYLQQIPIAVVNPEPIYPKAGKLLTLALEKVRLPGAAHPFFQVTASPRVDAMEALKEGKAVGVIVIPSGFTEGLQGGRGSERVLLVLRGDDRRAQVLVFELQALIRKFGFLVEKSKGEISREPVELSVRMTGAEALDPELESLADIFLFAFLFLIPYAGGQWVGEIERGSFQRFRMARISPAALFAGTFIATLSLAFLQTAFLLAAAYGIGMRPYMLFVWAWPVAFVLALASHGLGLLLSSFIEKEKQLNLISSFIILPLYFISGTLGSEIVKSAWLDLLPWHQGYSIMSDSLLMQFPGAAAAGKMLAVSLALALIGAGIFAGKRLRYG